MTPASGPPGAGQQEPAQPGSGQPGQPGQPGNGLRGNGLRGRSVAIVGGGIAGLTAAFLLRDAGMTVTVLEGSPRIGGKLTVSEVGGIEVDACAEALLARRLPRRSA